MQSWAALFGRSPFEPLQRHMGAVARCSAQLVVLFDTLFSGADIGSIVDGIAELESDADEVKNQLREHLPRHLLLPVGRRDLLEILDLQDEIADQTEALALMMAARPWTAPQPFADALKRSVATTCEVVAGVDAIINEVDELVEVGFAGPERARVLAMITAVDSVETVTDGLRQDALITLFAHESTLSPVDVVLWVRALELLGEISGAAKKVGGRMRLLIAK